MIKLEQKVKTWIRAVGKGDHLVQLNEMLAAEAAQGWELIHFAAPPVAQMTFGVWTFAFKRQVPDGERPADG